MQSQYSGDCFQGARCSERMAVHGFRRTNRQLVRMRAKNLTDGAALDRVVSRRPSAVCVDIANLFRRHVGKPQRVSHRACRPFNCRLRQVVSIGRHAEAANLRIDSRTARSGRFPRLKYHHRATLAQDHSAPVLAERAAGIRRDHTHRFPGLQVSDRERRLTAAGHC